MLAAKRTSAAPVSSVGSCQKHLNFKGKKNPYWGLVCKAFGITELGPFAVKGEGLGASCWGLPGFDGLPLCLGCARTVKKPG